MAGARQVASVKQFLMDAHVVVGVGNIDASEALHVAGITPSRPAGRMPDMRLSHWEARDIANYLLPKNKVTGPLRYTLYEGDMHIAKPGCVHPDISTVNGALLLIRSEISELPAAKRSRQQTLCGSGDVLVRGEYVLVRGECRWTEMSADREGARPRRR